jgi:hypothetical protein
MANNATGNFDESYFLSIPRVSNDSTHLSITQLRENLQEKGRLRDACALLVIELNFLPDPEARIRACRSLLEACGKASPREPLWYVEGRVRLLLAQKLRSNGQVSEADREFQSAKELLLKAPLPATSNFSGLDIGLAELRSSQSPSPDVQLRLWETFSEQPAVQKDGFMISTAITQAAEAALEVLAANPSQENREIFWRWQNSQEALLEELGDTYFLYLGHTGNADRVAHAFEDFGVILNWHNEFDAKHPTFNLWALRLLGKNRVIDIYRRLKDNLNVEQTARDMNELARQRDQFWKEDGNNLSSGAEKAGQLDSESVGDASETRVYKSWIGEWIDEVPLTFDTREMSHFRLGSAENEISPRAVLKTLVRWLQMASADGKLDETQIRCILAPGRGPTDTLEVDTLLAKLTPESLRLDLFGTKASPTPNSRWEEVFAILSEWLRHRATYNETKRHYLLYQLQLDMLNTVQESEDILVQAQGLMDLVPTLCAEAQQHMKSGRMHWRNMIAIAKNTKYTKLQNAPLSDDTASEFIEVLDLYKLSLDDAIKAGNTLGEAMTALYIAHLYYWGAMLLKKTMFELFFKYLDQSNDAFQKRREGWKVLSGWDKVDKLLQAVSERARLQIAPLAIVVMSQIQAI